MCDFMECTLHKIIFNSFIDIVKMWETDFQISEIFFIEQWSYFM